MKKNLPLCRLVFTCLITLVSFVTNAQLKSNFSADVTEGCTPLVVKLTDLSTGNPTSWSWDLGNGITSTEQNPGLILINPGTYSIKLTITDANGKDALTKTSYIKVYGAPDVNFSAAGTTGCSPLMVTFKDNSKPVSGVISEHIWEFGDGQISKDVSPKHLFTFSDTFNVTLTVVNSFGCKKTATLNELVKIPAAAKSNFTYTYTDICRPPAEIDFTNTSTSQAPLSYSWDFGDGTKSDETDPAHIYNAGGNFKVRLISTTEYGCSDTIFKTISVGSIKPAFKVADSVCTNQPLLFQNTSNPVPGSVDWSFGDGGISDVLNPVYSFPKAGTYTVRMNADFGTCSGSATKVVVVTDKPKASFTTTGTLESCVMPLVVNFSSTSVGASSYKWLFGDGKSSTLPNVSYAYGQAGTYSVSLVAFNSNGCSDTITYKDLVKTGAPVITGFANLPYTGCVPATVSFKSLISTSLAVTSYAWNFGDGTTSTLENPSYTYTKSGTYKVSLSITTEGGCTASYTMDRAVMLAYPPVVDFSADPLSSCAYLPVVFADKTTGDVDSWLWLFGDGGSSTLKNPSYQYQDTGYFSVTLIARNKNCADTLIKEKYVQIFPPVAKFKTIVNCVKRFERTFIDASIGAVTRLWNFGDGKTSTVLNPVHTYASVGRYRVSLTVTNGACEYIRYDSVFIVDEHPDFTFTPEKDIVCKNDVINFQATNFNARNIKNLAWNFGDSTKRDLPSSIALTVYKYRKAGIYNPTLITTDINNCNDTINKSLQIKVYGPTAAFSNVMGACINSPVIFTDKSYPDSLHPIVSYSWNFGNKTYSNVAGSVQNLYSAPGSYTVSLALKDSYGCVDSLVKTNIIIISKPLAQFTIADSIICSKNNVVFKNTSAGTNLTYLWNFGDGKTSTLRTPVNSYATQGTYTVTLIVSDKYSCKDTITRAQLLTIADPVAAFILNDTVGLCPPLLIEPVNASKNYQSLKWEFGDGSNTNLARSQKYYNIPGTYSLNLIAKGFGNCADTAKKIILLKGPWGTLNYTKLTGCVPTSVTFTSTSRNVAEFVWDFNNGVLKKSPDSTATYKYLQPGSYLPKLVLIDSAGCKVSVENKDRIVISDVKAAFTSSAPPSLVCDSALNFFKDSSKVFFDTLTSYKWNLGDNQSATTSSVTKYYSNAGTYNVKLVVTSKTGCTDSVSMPVTVNVNKSPVIAASVKDSVCETFAAKFFASNSSGQDVSTTWLWNFGDGKTATTANAEYLYAAAGTYTATVKATASNGCVAVKSTKVKIFSNPSVSLGIDTAVCLGQAVRLAAAGASNYTWLADASLSCLNCADPVAKPLNSTWYFATGLSAQGCKAFDSVFVKVHKPMLITAQGSGRFCLGQSTTFRVSGSDKYQWTPNTYLDNANSDQPVFKATAPTEITYTVVGKDNRNCFNDTAQVTVKVYPIPTVDILEKDLVANSGYSVQLRTSSSIDVTSWRWTPAAGLSDPYDASPFATPNSNMTYTVVASNDGNCTATDEVSISVLCDGRNVLIPNTFSPNNDGVNERFYPRGKGVNHIKSMRVFNRWGQVVYEKMNMDANDPSQGWDGTFKGQPQSLDVYVYVMEITCDNGTVNKINGNITLLR